MLCLDLNDVSVFFFGGGIDKGCEIDTEMVAQKSSRLSNLLYGSLCGPNVCEVILVPLMVSASGKDVLYTPLYFKVSFGFSGM